MVIATSAPASRNAVSSPPKPAPTITTWWGFGDALLINPASASHRQAIMHASSPWFQDASADRPIAKRYWPAGTPLPGSRRLSRGANPFHPVKRPWGEHLTREGDGHETNRDQVQDEAGGRRPQCRTGEGGVRRFEGCAARGRALSYAAARGRQFCAHRRDRGGGRLQPDPETEGVPGIPERNP